MNMKHKYDKEQLLTIVKESLSIAQVCRKLNIRPSGGNYKSLQYNFKKWEIDITHFTGKAWNVGKRFKKFGKEYKLENILIKDSPYRSSTKLKLKLFNTGLKERMCENCRNIQWMNKLIPLEIDHINGDNTDNRIENLRILCPNCHAQTPTYRSKNKMSAFSEKKKMEFLTLGETFGESLLLVNGNVEPGQIKSESLENERRTSKVKPIKICLFCNNEFETSSRRKTYCSVECCNLDKRSNIPSKEELQLKKEELTSFVAISKFYNVSDNSVRKWFRLYDWL